MIRLPWLSDAKEKAVAVDNRNLFEVTILDGHAGSGTVHLRQTLLAASLIDALAIVLEAWTPARVFEGGISIQVGRGWVSRGGYRNERGVALMERPNGTRSLVLTEFDGTVTTFDSDAAAWVYLQDHHYQSVNS